MVKRHLRSTKIVKKKRKLPSGITGIIFRKKEVNKPRCPETKKVLNGKAYGRKRKLRNYAKTEKRPTRYYGGVLSHRGLKSRLLKRLKTLIGE